MQSPNQKIDDGFLTVDGLVEYSRMSKRKLLSWLHHPVKPIPHRRIGQRIYVKRSEFDTWTEQFRVEPSGLDVQALVDELVPTRGRRR
jgi:hypothetical protein